MNDLIKIYTFDKFPPLKIYFKYPDSGYKSFVKLCDVYYSWNVAEPSNKNCDGKFVTPGFIQIDNKAQDGSVVKFPFSKNYLYITLAPFIDCNVEISVKF